MRFQNIQSRRHSLKYQMLIILLSAVVPYAIRLLFISQDQPSLNGLHLTLAAGLLGGVLSVFAIRNIEQYPGVESVSSVLSLTSLIYCGLVVVFLIGRIDYVRGVLIGNYLLCVGLLFAEQFSGSQRRQLRIAIVESKSAKPFQAPNIEWIIVSDPDTLIENIDALTVDLRADLPEAWERRITNIALAGIPVYHIKHLRESVTGMVELEHLAETSYGTLSPPYLYILLKRAIDMIVAAIALILFCPVMLAVALIVRLDSPGPAIFRQKRIGFRGHPFIVRKFRTMQVAQADGDSRSAAMTRTDDVRITRVGAFLRKSRLDELPQLINILRGEMSLIGPRPEAAVLSAWYEDEIPLYRYRHIVMPGVTGWAQVNQGHVTNVEDVKAKLHYDFYYIKHLSPWIDMLIALRTVLTMISGHGAR
ncbi:sugar transferase [Sphingomonas floccifaciens]|uniref:Sugar transferase n=1 Tax=Sphingomonas floccifaciens TaxID=1844115 RepID=A0ABW4NGL6_9SPHN